MSKIFDNFLEAVNHATFAYYSNDPFDDTVEYKQNGNHFIMNSTIQARGRIDGMRHISVNVHLDKPINEVLGSYYESFKELIRYYNECFDCEDSEVASKYGRYDYFFDMIPVCDFADLLGTLEQC